MHCRCVGRAALSIEIYVIIIVLDDIIENVYGIIVVEVK